MGRGFVSSWTKVSLELGRNPIARTLLLPVAKARMCPVNDKEKNIAFSFSCPPPKKFSIIQFQFVIPSGVGEWRQWPLFFWAGWAHLHTTWRTLAVSQHRHYKEYYYKYIRYMSMVSQYQVRQVRTCALISMYLSEVRTWRTLMCIWHASVLD